MSARNPLYNIDPADLVNAVYNVPPLDGVRHHVERIVAETDRWCWKAIAQGVGNRVWRSEPEPMKWPAHGYTCRFAVLTPGQPAPGRGVVFGPFS